MSTIVRATTVQVDDEVTPGSPLVAPAAHRGDGLAAAEARVSRTTPAVVGLNVLDASSLINGAGLTIVIRQLETSVAARGTVLSQRPPAGERLDPGSLVRVVVASRLPLASRQSR